MEFSHRRRPLFTAPAPDQNYFIKQGYVARAGVDLYPDPPAPPIIHQPDVYTFAARLAKQFGCDSILDIGCGRASKLIKFHPEFKIIGVDHPTVIAAFKEKFQFGEWIEWNLDSPGLIPLDPTVVKNAVIICADVIEHLQFPEYLLENLHWLLNTAPVALVSTPERDLVRGGEADGPPANHYHVREWNLPEFNTLLLRSGFNLEFIGLTLNNSQDRLKRTTLAVLANHDRPQRQSAPADFNIVAIIKSFNEADIIAPALSHLIEKGIQVYLIDNWSTDATVDIARSFLGKGLLQIEHYPPEGRQDTYQWVPLLRRTEEVALTLNANWYIHHDVDEYREAPWPDLSLRDGLYHADQCGFNAVDFTLVNFQPVDNGFMPGTDFVHSLRHWEFGLRPGHFLQVKAWKNTGQRVNLTDTGGHHVKFNDQRVYPYKFLLRHYPFRTNDQASRKVNEERRVHPDEVGKMNTHYSSLQEVKSFIQPPQALKIFDETFYPQFLVERLSGINILPEETAEPSVQLHRRSKIAKPNLFVVGAPRCGTTAIRSYLMQHPDIYFPKLIEMNFFGSDLLWAEDILQRYPRTLEGYLFNYAQRTSQKYAGDKTPLYLYSRTAAQEIKAFSPDARIVVMLRNPVEMLFSIYAHLRRGGLETCDTFEKALKLEPARKAGLEALFRYYAKNYYYYLEIPQFASQLQRYFHQFGREQVHIVIYDDLKKNTAAVYTALLQFLQVDDTFQPDFPVINAGPENLAAMLPETRQRLQNFFRTEIEHLSKILERDLGHWCESQTTSDDALDVTVKTLTGEAQTGVATRSAPGLNQLESQRERPVPAQAKTVCIAGMHRSGTSMVARLLNLCGLYLGDADDLLQPAADNPAGYWENTQFSVLNEKILARLGGAWDVPPPLAAGWEFQAGLAALYGEAERLVAPFQDCPVWGWKDPRNSLTLPFWKSILPDLKVVICLRHPLAVAWSLNARGQSSLLFGLTLWQSYNQSLLATGAEEWIITHYDAYFADPARELRRVVNRLGLEVSEAMIAKACQSVAVPLHHQRASADDFSLSDIPSPIIELYQTLCAQAEWTDDTLAAHPPSPAASRVAAPPTLAEAQPSAPLLALEQLLLEKDRAVAFLNSQFEERQRAVAFLNMKLEDHEHAIDFLKAKLEEQERAVAALKDQLKEQTQARERLQQEQAKGARTIARLQQELQAARTTAEATSKELESLHRTKFYRLAAFYWHWLDKLRTQVRGSNR